MLNPGRFPGSLLRSGRSLLQALVLCLASLAAGLAMCVVIHQAPYATASDSAAPLATNVIRSAADLNWRQSPSSPLNSPGKNSVTLDPCPPAVIAAEPWYYVYISGMGTPEAVRVTGGSCKGDGRPGTLEFTTTYAHPAGYVVSSASGGVQEASIAARFVLTNPAGTPQGGRVVVPPGEYDVFAPISIRATNQTVDFAGSTLNCYTASEACIFVGDRANSNLFENITLNGPRGRPMVVASTKPFIEVNGEQTRIFNVSSRWPPRGGSFGSYVQVDDDQAFLLDGMDTQIGGSAVTCNPMYCGAFVMAPGPFNHWSAVGWLKHLNISLQCAAKGVEWISGNGLKISDSVIQGWSVFGVRVSSQRGGYAGLITDNVYFEASPSCQQYSPFGNVGSAAIIAEGVQVKIMGLTANGPNGVYPNWGAQSGTRDWLYWVVPVHPKFGDGVPLPAGHALTTGTRSITGAFPKIAGASSYKILKIDWDRGTLPVPYPQGTGNYLLTTVQQSACATLACQFKDNGEGLSTYTNAGENLSPNLYMPRLDFWPGGVVLSPAVDMSTANYSMQPLPVQADVIGVGGVVSTLPAWSVAAEADTLAWASPGIPPAAANVEALHTNALGPLPGATILKAANLAQTSPSGHKGRLNFGYAGQTQGFTPLITLGDSNWGKTWADSGHRPPADVNDLDLGYEGDIDTLYSRAQREVREYIGKSPDGKPQERLTAVTKTFNVPVTINGNLTVTGKCVGCTADPINVASSSGGSPWKVSLTGQKGAIAPTDLCASSPCAPGQYRISYYLDATAACASPGNAAAALAIGWKDETSARTMRVPLAGSGISGGNSLSLGGSAHFGGGTLSLWSAGSAPITYSVSYKACTKGTGIYAVRITLEKAQ